MDPKRLEIFCRVFETGSVSRAAAELNLTQPGASQHLRRLERDVGVRLFARKGREIAPTEAAEILYPHARAILDAGASARSRLAEHAEGRRGHVVVGASTTGVLYYLPPMFRSFRQSHPDVSIALRAEITDRIREAVAIDAVDIGIVWGPVADSRLAAEPIARDRFALVASPANPLAGQRAVSRAAVNAQPFVLPIEGSTTRRFVESRLREIGVVPRPQMEFDTTEAMKRAVEGNLGIALVSRKAAERELRDGHLVALEVPGADFGRDIVIIRRRDRVLSPAMAAVLAAARSFTFVGPDEPAQPSAAP